MGSDPQFAKYPSLSLAQNIFSLVTSPKSAQHTSLKYLQDAIKEHRMAPLYRHLAHPRDGILNTIGEGTVRSAGSHTALKRSSSIVSSNLIPPQKTVASGILPWDELLYEELKADNEKELEGMQKEEEDAEENAGETELQAVKGKRAEFWARVGDKVS